VTSASDPVAAIPELHVASLVVHAQPARLDTVAAAISALPGAEVHGRSALGKLVVTLETPGMDGMMTAVRAIQEIDGVLSATLVYQCVDTLAAMNEELADDRTS
jgi:nitrate reductase NapD